MLEKNKKIAIGVAVILIVIVAMIFMLPNKNKEVVSKIEKIEDVGNAIYERYTQEDKKPTLEDMKTELEKEGYTIIKVSTDKSIKGISLSKEKVVLKTNEATEIEVNFKEDKKAIKYYVDIDGKKYRMMLGNNVVAISRKVSEVNESDIIKNELDKLEVSSSNINIEATAKENKILMSSSVESAKATITVKYEEFEATCEVAVIEKPSDDMGANEQLDINTSYGVIDVVWIDRGNNVINNPLDPESYLGDMEKVTWSYNEKTESWTEDKKAKEEWYSYVASNGQNDEKQSYWANAKLVQKGKDNAYFVWIPRYAYRITYYKDENYSDVVGYYDGYGMWSAETGMKKYNLDEDIQTVTYNGDKYIVHPAFVDESNNKVKYSNGGWDKDLAGIWVSKYEMSGSKTNLESLPNVESLTNMTIGEQYTASIDYNQNQSSHMMKNSEWGAVVYLAFSQYGRNGNQIDYNNSKITGNGSGVVATLGITGTENAYNTKIGANASTTGNVYGIYDISGGVAERVAAFCNIDKEKYMQTSKWTEATELSKNSESTKYASKYYGIEESSNAEAKIGKIGDATKEVALETELHWFGNTASIFYQGKPFLTRGGSYKDIPSSGSGLFCTVDVNGEAEESEGFRVVLCP